MDITNFFEIVKKKPLILVNLTILISSYKYNVDITKYL